MTREIILFRTKCNFHLNGIILKCSQIFLFPFSGLEKWMDVLFVFSGTNRDNINIQMSIAHRMIKRFHIAPSSLNVGGFTLKDDEDVHESFDLRLTSTESKRKLMENLNLYRYPVEIQTDESAITSKTADRIEKMFNDAQKLASKSVVFFVDSRKNYFLDFPNMKKRFDGLGINVVVVVVADDDGSSVAFSNNVYNTDNTVFLKKDYDRKDVSEIMKKTLRGRLYNNI